MSVQNSAVRECVVLVLFVYAQSVRRGGVRTNVMPHLRCANRNRFCARYMLLNYISVCASAYVWVLSLLVERTNERASDFPKLLCRLRFGAHARAHVSQRDQSARCRQSFCRFTCMRMMRPTRPLPGGTRRDVSGYEGRLAARQIM